MLTPFTPSSNRLFWIISAVWVAGVVALVSTIPEHVVVVHWANGHMMDRPTLFPAFAARFNAAVHKTASGKPIEVRLVRANSGEITGELISRVLRATPLDRHRPDPTVVTPAADHWMGEVNQAAGYAVVDRDNLRTPATTYIGVVAPREVILCLGWAMSEIGFAEVIRVATSYRGWDANPCTRPEWGQEARVAFTYPSRSSTARSVLYALYGLAAGKPHQSLTSADATRPEVVEYIQRFRNTVDCYVPDTLDLNIKLLSDPACAHFFFVAEDNLVKLYQGKVEVPIGDKYMAKSLDRDMVMIYLKEGSVVHNHSAFIVRASWVASEQVEAANAWIAFLLEEPQQQAFMQEGFRRTTSGPCVDPLGSPFRPCTLTPTTPIYPDRLDPTVAAEIINSWR